MAATVHEIGTDALRVEIATTADALSQTFGPRFDRTAYVSRLRADDRDFLHPFGLCDEFGITGLGVLGYEDANPGEGFLKIGVGRLSRMHTGSYHFNERYPVAEEFPVEIHASANRVSLRQAGATADGRHGYDYRKSYAVSGRILRIDYELANTGNAPFEFEHYNHNWFSFAKNPIDASYRVELSFPPPLPPPPEWQVEDRGIRRTGSGPMHAPAWRFGRPPDTLSQISVANDRLDMHVEIAPDFHLSRFALWSNGVALCPEPFLQRNLPPGARTRWSISYRFCTAESEPGPLPSQAH